MADKYTFKDADGDADFKDRQIKLEKTIKQSEFFSVRQFEFAITVCDAKIAREEAKKLDLQAKIDAATKKLG
tara:strand:+ start:589 stop:804 length:216 start_codon:yes stop_codon:yes gene_type:complete